MESEATMPTIEVWIALGEDGVYGTDEDTAIEHLQDGSGEDLTSTACRLVKLNVTMNEPRYRDDDDDKDKPVEVTVTDDAGRVVELE
jgi:hypothetical protein